MFPGRRLVDAITLVQGPSVGGGLRPLCEDPESCRNLPSTFQGSGACFLQSLRVVPDYALPHIAFRFSDTVPGSDATSEARNLAKNAQPP